MCCKRWKLYKYVRWDGGVQCVVIGQKSFVPTQATLTGECSPGQEQTLLHLTLHIRRLELYKFRVVLFYEHLFLLSWYNLNTIAQVQLHRYNVSDVSIHLLNDGIEKTLTNLKFNTNVRISHLNG
jgi:hypothetical protein